MCYSFWEFLSTLQVMIFPYLTFMHNALNEAYEFYWFNLLSTQISWANASPQPVTRNLYFFEFQNELDVAYDFKGFFFLQEDV